VTAGARRLRQGKPSAAASEHLIVTAGQGHDRDDVLQDLDDLALALPSPGLTPATVERVTGDQGSRTDVESATSRDDAPTLSS
jgi:hypothetical protein